jgi:sugar lactone lactonase YvrE
VRSVTVTVLLLLLGLLGGPAYAQTGPVTSFPLPDGFQPEGIAIGPGSTAFFGSRATGAIYRADLRTGRGRVISPGPGTPSLGMKTEGRRLYVAGGSGGDARVLDTRTGEVLASYPLVSGPSFVNDVVLTGDAAWFTDSTNPVLYKIRKGRVTRLPLSGEIVYGTGVNANGIVVTPDGRGLLIVQSNTGLLFHVDPGTGTTRRVDLGGEILTNGDGLLLNGRTLHVVQNRLNTVAVFTLSRDGLSGRLVKKLTDPRFDVPTTVAAHGGLLYLPNARFTTPPTPTTTYDVVGIRR